MTGFSFDLSATDGEARAGTFHTPHGPVQTPAFQAVGTRGCVRGVLPRDLHEVGSRIILANTYHLHLRPGEALFIDNRDIAHNRTPYENLPDKSRHLVRMWIAA